MKLCPKCQKQFSDDANFCPVDAARLVAAEGQVPAAAAPDALAQRFQIEHQLGGSRTGAVHRATDRQTGAAVAVKVVSPAVVALPNVAQRLERELKQLERVQSAGVAKVVASGKRSVDDPASTWVACELLDGAQTLAEAITARGPIPLAQAAHLIEVVGEALIEAAQVGVVHRDLAPKNVLFAGDQIKLINFSLPVPTTERVPGVPEFVAPEQVEGKPVDQRSNLYSLGALYYYVLTGQTVHAGNADEVYKAHVNGTIRTPSSLAPVPGPVESVIMRALDRSPTKRFLTVRQFVDEVGRVARGEADPKTTAPMGKAGGRHKGELVQTLLGVRSGPAGSPFTPILGAGAQPASGPAFARPGTPPPAAAAAMVPNPPVVPSTMAGVVPQSHPAILTPTGMSAPPMAAPVAVAAGPTSLPPPERSPWAPPPTVPPNQPGPMAGAQAAVASAAPGIANVAPPVVAAPVIAAPVVAPPVIANAPAGKKKAAEAETKGKFRETLWFKKGDLDVQAAVAAAEERAKTGKDTGTDRADSLPIDERYKDDGTISRGDKEKYSLRTGATQMMGAVKDPHGTSASRVSEDALIDEMKGGRNMVLVFILLGIAVIAAIVFFVVR